MLIPARTMAPLPTHTSDPMSIGLPNSSRRPLLCVERMERRVDLHRRPEEGVIANSDTAHVQHNAIEVEEHPLAEFDIRPVIAEEGRLHPHGVANLAEQLAQNATTSDCVSLARGI